MRMNFETYRNFLIKLLSVAILMMFALICAYFFPQKNSENPVRTDEISDTATEKPVSTGSEILTTATTNWIIKECYADGTIENIPVEITAAESALQLIGLSREELTAQIAAYMDHPSPEDAARELIGIEIESFSPEKIVLQKIFAREQDTFYFLVFQNDFLVVYENDLNSIFMNTGIEYDDLPLNHQTEIRNCKIIYGQEELFCYLEALTS